VPESSHESKSALLTRREALKVLAAATGAVALSTLPQTWKTPIVEVGVLPAHAQGASGPAPVVSNVSGSWLPVFDAPSAKTSQRKASNCNVTITFNYQDTLGQVTNSSMVLGTFSSQIFNGSANLNNGSTGYTGSITFPFASSTCVNSSAPVSVRLLVQGRYSNVSNGVVNPPNYT
jgi:hypothetical protein